MSVIEAFVLTQRSFCLVPHHDRKYGSSGYGPYLPFPIAKAFKFTYQKQDEAIPIQQMIYPNYKIMVKYIF